MYRVAILAIVLPLLFVGAASGQVWVDDMALGVAVGVMQPSGGDESYEGMGLTFGLRMKKPVTENVWVMLDYRHGETESGETPGSAEFFTWGAPDDFKTNWNYIGLKTIYDFKTDASVIPYVSFGLGMTMWEVRDWTDSKGTVPKGFDADGVGGKTLSGNNLTASLGGGVEFFLNEKTSIDVGGSYGFLLQQNLDNVGFSSLTDYGADYVDANNAVFEGSIALMFHFGPGDCDEDGIFGSQDDCPQEPEDYDGFEDEDGCPDVDNDMDTILDVDDDCPDDAEDFNGFQDEDGCPDADSDGDGVLDIHDECPDTPAGVIVDAVGCPKPEPKPVVVPVPKPELIAVMVNFALDSAVLDDMATGRLDALVTFLLEDTTVTVDVGGHASSEGAAEYNQALSERRAVAVRDYLAEKGIEAGRVTVVGYGVQQPLVPNDSESNRSQNRRAIVTPVYPE